MEVDTIPSPVGDVQTKSAEAASPLSDEVSPLPKLGERTKSQAIKMNSQTIKMNSAQLQAILVTVAALQDTVEELQDDLKDTKERLKKNQAIIKALWKRQQGSNITNTEQTVAMALGKFKAAAKSEESKEENEDHVNRRIAKDMSEGIVFGTISESWMDGTESKWHVVYDNADEEDLNKSQLMASISLYSKKKKDDPRWTSEEENQEKPATESTTVLQSQPKESVDRDESSSTTATTSLMKGVEYTEAVNEINKMTENSVDSISDATVNGIEKITAKTADVQSDITGLTDSSMDSITDATVNGIEKITSKTSDSLERIEEVSSKMHGDFSNNCKAEVEKMQGDFSNNCKIEVEKMQGDFSNNCKAEVQKTTATLNISISKADALVTKLENTMSRAEGGLKNMPKQSGAQQSGAQQSGGSGIYNAKATSMLDQILSGNTPMMNPNPTITSKPVERTKSLPPQNQMNIDAYEAETKSMMDTIMSGKTPTGKPAERTMSLPPQNSNVYNAKATSMLDQILSGNVPTMNPNPTPRTMPPENAPQNAPQKSGTDAYSGSIVEQIMSAPPKKRDETFAALQAILTGKDPEESKEAPAGSKGYMVDEIIKGANEPKKEAHFYSIYDPNPALKGWPF